MNTKQKTHLGNEDIIRLGHGQRAEELLEVIGQIGPAGISGVHGDEDGHVGVDGDHLLDDLDLDGGGRGLLLQQGLSDEGLVLLERLLDGLDLLGDGGEHALLQPVELVEAAPGANLLRQWKAELFNCIVIVIDKR